MGKKYQRKKHCQYWNDGRRLVLPIPVSDIPFIFSFYPITKSQQQWQQQQTNPILPWKKILFLREEGKKIKGNFTHLLLWSVFDDKYRCVLNRFKFFSTKKLSRFYWDKDERKMVSSVVNFINGLGANSLYESLLGSFFY